ncbi:MAG TPA: GTPase HflX [Gammaproteobacteria bacterium]|nr:GTPase HflX [Gammaproteobacteria bacterium]
MFERPDRGERVLLVQVDFRVGSELRADCDELRELARASGADVIDVVRASRTAPEARYFIGAGKVDEIAERVEASNIELVIFNHALSPSQERNLENRLRCRVLDRTTLILDIFARRARSHEGKLQVELAQLKHLSTRLVRGWTHLERQKGGIGLRGPGEKQLETDRRLLNERIKTIERRLEKVTAQRNQGRQARRKADIPTISLVGYTNAGKSTLFNALSGATVYAANQLFATLDPTLRRVELAGGFPVVLADTVGFIRHLPHDLVKAFQATLQETEEADLLLHVIDASDPQRDDNIEQVDRVLAEIGADQRPRLLVYNKIDLTGLPARADDDEQGNPERIWVSAHTGAGLDLLIERIGRFFLGETLHGKVRLPMAAGRIRAELFSHHAVKRETVDAAGYWDLEVALPRSLYQRLSREHQEFSLEAFADSE